jgi:hypothetical protein
LLDLARPSVGVIGGILLAVLCAAPASAIDVRYEGRREFVRGQPACTIEPSEVHLELGGDGGVRGEVLTADGAVRFFGTVGLNGKLIGSYRASADAEYTRIEGAFSDDRFAGITQSKSCRYSLDLNRRD